MVANKVDGVRAASLSDVYSAHMAREHNNANVLCLGQRVVGEGLATELLDAFVNARFSPEERHHRRVDKIGAIEREGASR
jgi:ribose 5-phosphate isomerase B